MLSYKENKSNNHTNITATWHLVMHILYLLFKAWIYKWGCQ